MPANVAIVPVRTGSKRLPEKNFRDFFGKPMFIHTLQSARDSELFGKIIVSTESEKVAELAEKYGFDVPDLRPAHLATDEATLIDVCEYHLTDLINNNFSMKYFCLLLATSPMRDQSDMKHAYEKLMSDANRGIVAVREFQKNPFTMLIENREGSLEPFFEKFKGQRHENMPNPVLDAGSMYWYEPEAFLNHKYWYFDGVKPYLLDQYKAVDIDTPEDWELAEFYYQEHVLQN